MVRCVGLCKCGTNHGSRIKIHSTVVQMYVVQGT